jgi:hypothetical protein
MDFFSWILELSRSRRRSVAADDSPTCQNRFDNGVPAWTVYRPARDLRCAWQWPSPDQRFQLLAPGNTDAFGTITDAEPARVLNSRSVSKVVLPGSHFALFAAYTTILDIVIIKRKSSTLRAIRARSLGVRQIVKQKCGETRASFLLPIGVAEFPVDARHLLNQMSVPVSRPSHGDA